MKQYFIFEMKNFTKEEAQEFFNIAFHDAEWEDDQGMIISQLNESGTEKVKQILESEPNAKN